ncbi:MAG: hypothetical protein ACRDVK_06190 [Acidimicrobiia bacterium]
MPPNGSSGVVPANRARGRFDGITDEVMRAGKLRDYATQAGFREIEVLPFEPGFLRFYRLS